MYLNIVRNQIMNSLNMKLILNNYGIKINSSNMFKCPFHKDDKPSAKCYDNSFYCFSCNRSGDLIQFVKYLYKLNFQEAMEKIIDDFGLGLKSKGNYDKSKILEMQRQDKLRELEKEKKKDYFRRLCKRKDLYDNLINKWQKEINPVNWEDMTLAISYLENKRELLDIFICEQYNIEY